MESDGPLGAFLSGGIDSSVVVSAMQAVSNRPVKTFSIGFHEADYNEAEFAGKVAKHLGTDHSELYVSPQDALDVVPLLPTMYDEPFADSSQIPTYLVSQLARESVTVSLSGDGGDELFCGYSRYFDAAQRLEQLRSDKPGAIQRLFAQTSLPEFLDRGAGLTMRALRRPAWPPRFQNLASRWRVGDDGIAPELACYLPSINHWNDPNSLVLKGEPYPGLTNDFDLWPDMAPYQLQLQSVDAVTYLPDDILVKVDRASMAVSLESRVPLLDHRIVEFAWSLPHRLRVKDGKGKWVLREVLSRYVPREYFERPKMGFGVPIDSWLRAELKDWAEELLREERLKDQGLFDPGPIREAWKAHLDGHSHHYQLWNVLMFQAWLDSSLAS
jgi:asparagine synthase (glutamine-hydrolysing)